MRCSICGRAFDSEQSRTMPFCSQRCKDIDRNRWLNEEYGLPWEPEVERPEGTDPSADNRGG
ncbi:MAG: DNA gyrase inhibitor YacG [Planctomycetaceae bacterium]|nr:DNA gyrase inhibitor YacG [Planctomycetaceae bacterium]